MKFLRATITATAIGLAMLLGWVGVQSTPSTEAVRLRNALLFEAPRADVGAWTPDQVPRDFLAERRAVPSAVAEAARAVSDSAGGSGLQRSRALVAHLLVNTRDSGPIHEVGVETTYRSIIEDGRGYCSDYIDTFIAMAHAAGIPVRAWAFSFDGFGGYGHIVAEVFDRSLGQWVMLDVFNNVHPVEASSGTQLSAVEFRNRFAADEASIAFVPIGPGRVAYGNDAKLRAYYRNGLDQWYLWNGNNVVTRHEALPYQLLSVAPGATQLLSIALGDHPRIVPVASATNGKLIERMRTLGARLHVVLVVIVLLSLALLVQALFLMRARRATRSAGMRVGAVEPAATRWREDRHA